MPTHSRAIRSSSFLNITGLAFIALAILVAGGCGPSQEEKAEQARLEQIEQEKKEQNDRNTCIDNLRQIENARAQLYMEGTIPTAKEIFGPDKYIKQELRCPSDPSKPYVIPTDDSEKRTTCPNVDRFPEHVLPGRN